MKALYFLAALLLAAPAWASQPLLALSSDQLNYAVGATAKLSVAALVRPQDSGDDFYLGATLNGAPIGVTQANGMGESLVQLGASGVYIWAVQLYLEDAVFAAQLNLTIAYLNLQNAQITTQLGQTTNPAQIAALQAELAQNQSLINEANNQLALIRRPFGASQSLIFSAN